MSSTDESSVVVVTVSGLESVVQGALLEHGIVTDVLPQSDPCEGEATCGWLRLHDAEGFEFDEALLHSCGALFAVAALIHTTLEVAAPEELLSAIVESVQHSPCWSHMLHHHRNPQGSPPRPSDPNAL